MKVIYETLREKICDDKRIYCDRVEHCEGLSTYLQTFIKFSGQRSPKSARSQRYFRIEREAKELVVLLNPRKKIYRLNSWHESIIRYIWRLRPSWSFFSCERDFPISHLAHTVKRDHFRFHICYARWLALWCSLQLYCRFHTSSVRYSWQTHVKLRKLITFS